MNIGIDFGVMLARELPGCFDNHVHTWLSDGSQSPDQVCRLAREAGVQHLGITDHNVLLSEEEAERLSTKWRLDVIPGVELSTVYQREGRKTLLHLGLHWLPDSGPGVAELMAHNQSQPREERYVLRMLEMLFDLGLDPSHAGPEASLHMIRQAHPESLELGKRAVGDLLAAQGLVSSRAEAMEKYVGQHGQRLCYVDQAEVLDYAPLEWVMEVVQKNPGCVCTLNHPYHYGLETAELDRLMQDFHDLGGHAVEVIYPKHDKGRERALLRYCRRHGFLVNAGSDRHEPEKDFLLADPMVFSKLRDFHNECLADLQ